MRTIVHILRFVSYGNLLPLLAYVVGSSFGSCMRVPIGLIEILFPVITFIFIMGYGDLLANKNPWDSRVTFWVANMLFYASITALMIRNNHEPLSSILQGLLSNFHDAFIPVYQPYYALDAVGGLSVVTLIVWMPIAAVLSVIALIDTLRHPFRRASARRS